MLSVRNMVEFVCIPFILYGFWLYIKHNDNLNLIKLIKIGLLLFGMGISLRIQTITIILGFIFYLLFRKKFLEILAITLGIFTSFFMIHGIIDIAIWGYPFAEIISYIKHNLNNPFSYITHPWYQYIIVLIGILIPPLSILLITGNFFNIKKRLHIFLPIIFFISFHSLFPNKQERFIIPILPLVIINGTIGWNEILNRGNYFIHKITKISIAIFLIINFSLLPIFSTMYSKRSRIEAMIYLSYYPSIKSFIVDEPEVENIPLFPFYYLKQWNVVVFEHNKNTPIDSIASWANDSSINFPRFVLFLGNKNLNDRVEKMKNIYPFLEYDTLIKAGMIDNLIHKLNPINKNQDIYIYKNLKHE